MKKKKTKLKLHHILIKKGTDVTCKVTSEAKQFTVEVKKNAATAMIAAFSFVIALFWRDAIRDFIDTMVVKLGVPETGYIYKAIVALVVTGMGVLAIIKITKWSGVEKK